MKKIWIILFLLIVVLLAPSQGAFAIGEPSVTITLNKKSVEIAEMVTATYKIEGPGKYTNIFWDCTLWISKDEGQGGEGWGELEELTGSFAYAPQFGEAMTLNLYFRDETGRQYYYQSEKIPVTGYMFGYDVYSVIEGQETQIFTGENSLSFRADGEFEKYLGIQVDGKVVPSKYVKAWSGSTYAELSAEYLASLPDGEHELVIVFEDGVAVTKFATAKKIPELPQTGDMSNITLYMMLAAFSTICLMTMAKKSRTE